MTSATAPALTVREMGPDDEPAVLHLLRTSLAGGPAGERTAAFYRWKHHDNPFGRSLGLVAVDGGAVVGVRLLLRWQLQVGDQVVRAVRAVDTATHPGYRGRGIFRTLTLAALDRWRDEIDLVFNTPNAHSRPGYLSMGWQPVATVSIGVRAVRPVRFARLAAAAARRRSPDGTPGGAAERCSWAPASDVLSDEDAIAGLLDRLAAPPDRLQTARTLDYLRWRYGAASGLDYRAATVGSAAGLTGVAFARPRPRGGLVELTLAEILVGPGDRASAARLLRMAATSGTDHVTAHFHRDHPAAAILTRHGYLTAPRVGPSLVANPRRPLPVDPLRLRSWALSLGDVEVF